MITKRQVLDSIESEICVLAKNMLDDLSDEEYEALGRSRKWAGWYHMADLIGSIGIMTIEDIEAMERFMHDNHLEAT